MRSFQVLLSCVFAVVSVAAAAAEDQAFVPIAGANQVVVTAHEYGFDMPASIPSGLTTLLLHDEGKELHHLMLVRLDDGKGIADFMRAFAHPEGPPPSWVHMVGGPNTPAPGGTSNATLVLQPGNYVAFCTIPAPDGKPHIMHGMRMEFDVR